MLILYLFQNSRKYILLLHSSIAFKAFKKPAELPRQLRASSRAQQRRSTCGFTLEQQHNITKPSHQSTPLRTISTKQTNTSQKPNNSDKPTPTQNENHPYNTAQKPWPTKNSNNSSRNSTPSNPATSPQRPNSCRAPNSPSCTSTP